MMSVTRRTPTTWNNFFRMRRTGLSRSRAVVDIAGRYSFPVVLVTAGGSHVTRRSSEIILVDTGKNDWVVDKLP